jgi:3-polyprenyl-4-hydroxybenzoate decarboxylase
VELRDFKATLAHALARADFRTDLFVFANLSMDSLDYAGPRVNEGGKGVLLGCGAKKRELPREFHGAPPSDVRDVRVFVPGCLVVSAASHASDPSAPARLAAHPAFRDWPLVVVSDDAERATRSALNFLWTTFTRFDPAADLHAARTELVHNHASHTAPIALDARMKAWYPEELSCDEATARQVSRRWKEYFPAGGVEMGDSEAAHLD